MRINFYDTRIADNDTTILIKEKGVNYENASMNDPQKIARMMQLLLHMDTLAEEHCYMIALNKSCRVLGMFFISKGTADTSLLTPREVFIRAALIGAVQIILCHNHPSGNPLPSETDLKLTERFKKAGSLLYIPLADHIIIGKNSYFSFREQKLL